MAGLTLTDVTGEVMVIESSLVSLPALFPALTLKLNVPAAVGVPVIAPVLVLRLSPVGRLPLVILHVIGVEPVAASAWL